MPSRGRSSRSTATRSMGKVTNPRRRQWTTLKSHSIAKSWVPPPSMRPKTLRLRSASGRIGAISRPNRYGSTSIGLPAGTLLLSAESRAGRRGGSMFVQYAILGIFLIVASHPPQGGTTEDVIKEFKDRVERYWEIHKKA